MKDKEPHTWRTINGHEASATSSVQRCSITSTRTSPAIHKYLEATEDWEFLRDMGAILFETARCWAGEAHLSPRKAAASALTKYAAPMSTNQA